MISNYWNRKHQKKPDEVIPCPYIINTYQVFKLIQKVSLYNQLKN